jgi:hypothetical protein
MVKIHIPVLEEFNLPSPAGINYSAQTVALGSFFFLFSRTSREHGPLAGNYRSNMPRDRFEFASVESTQDAIGRNEVCVLEPYNFLLRFPYIKIMNRFEWRKHEADVFNRGVIIS